MTKENEEAIKYLQDYIDNGLWSSYVGGVVIPSLKVAISALKNIDLIKKERDVAIFQLHHSSDPCKYCKWADQNKQYKRCTSPNPCCVNGNPDRWEWKGAHE